VLLPQEEWPSMAMVMRFNAVRIDSNNLQHCKNHIKPENNQQSLK
jgi:hypothetical protein